MNATTLALPSWTADIQRYSQKVVFYTPIIVNAFNKTLAPVIVASLKGGALHLIERESVWKQWTLNIAGITHNPLQASFNAAYAELVSAEAQATYRRVRHIIREAATDALVVGLCGVVAIAEGVEFGIKVYRQAKAAYALVEAKLNPAGPQPVILPTVEMAIEEERLEDVQTLIDEDEEYERQFMARLERLDADALATVQDEAAIVQEEILQPNGLGEYVPVTGPITNPEPYDIHQDVQERLREIHSDSWCGAIASTDATTATVDIPAEDFASTLYVPGAEGKPNRNASRKKPKSNEGDAGAMASVPKRRAATKK